ARRDPGPGDPHRPHANRVRRHRPVRPQGVARLMPLILAVGAPAAAAGLYLLLGWNRVTAWLAAAAAVTVLSCGLALAAAGETREVGTVLRADGLSAFMLIVIGAVAFIASLAGPVYIADERRAGTIGPG